MPSKPLPWQISPVKKHLHSFTKHAISDPLLYSVQQPQAQIRSFCVSWRFLCRNRLAAAAQAPVCGQSCRQSCCVNLKRGHVASVLDPAPQWCSPGPQLTKGPLLPGRTCTDINPRLLDVRLPESRTRFSSVSEKPKWDRMRLLLSPASFTHLQTGSCCFLPNWSPHLGQSSFLISKKKGNKQLSSQKTAK